MDPDATWATLNDEDADCYDRDAAALSLLRWLAMGGYCPDIGGPPHLQRVRVVERCEYRLWAALDRLPEAQ